VNKYIIYQVSHSYVRQLHLISSISFVHWRSLTFVTETEVRRLS